MSSLIPSLPMCQVVLTSWAMADLEMIGPNTQMAARVERFGPQGRDIKMGYADLSKLLVLGVRCKRHTVYASFGDATEVKKSEQIPGLCRERKATILKSRSLSHVLQRTLRGDSFRLWKGPARAAPC